MKKQHALVMSTLLITAITVIFLIIWLPSHQAALIILSKQHPLLAPVFVIVIRIIGMVIPPIPGGLFSFALIPVIGWFWAYLYGVIGTTLGAVIAFLIARKFREPVVARFVPLQQLHVWEKKLSHKTAFFAFLIIRLTTGPIMDFISYLAGLSNISFWKFLLATIIAEIPPILVYYLGGKTYEAVAGKSNYAGIVFLILLVAGYYFFKDHEMVKGKK